MVVTANPRTRLTKRLLGWATGVIATLPNAARLSAVVKYPLALTKYLQLGLMKASTPVQMMVGER